MTKQEFKRLNAFRVASIKSSKFRPLHASKHGAKSAKFSTARYNLDARMRKRLVLSMEVLGIK